MTWAVRRLSRSSKLLVDLDCVELSFPRLIMGDVGERERLLVPRQCQQDAKALVLCGSDRRCNEAVVRAVGDEVNDGETLNGFPKEKRQLGLTSAIFLIVNRIIGTGIYATPSVILQSCGSVGFSLLVWLLGAFIAAAGTAVFIELGTGLPRNGGEKNYLEFIYRRPKFLVSYVYAMLVVLVGWAAASSVLFGEYAIHALDVPPTWWNSRMIGAVALTLTFILHGTRINWGLRVQNALGMFTLLVMAFAISAGLAVFFFPDYMSVEITDNLEWVNLWSGTRVEPNALVTALYNVIWCFNGYSNANYALSEVRDPIRTIKRAAPLALFAVGLVYILVNLSYFAVVSKAEILDGGRIVAALFFRNLFGAQAERFVSLIIALSLLGNMLAMQFTQGRVIQELGREGILPYSSWIASNQPFDTPMAGLFLQWAVCLITVTLPPPGDSFNFILQFSSYATVMINVAVSVGLIFLHTQRAKKRGYDWAPPFSAWTSAVAFFFFSNVFLAVFPLVPPAAGRELYERIPYFMHVVVALGIALLGVMSDGVAGENEPLLRVRSRSVGEAAHTGSDGVVTHEPIDGAAFRAGDEEENGGETFDDVPHGKRQLGLVSAAFLIFNRVIGTGIYATPSLILQSCGSIGLSLIMWLLGALIAAAGTAVFIELGTGLPRSGGEKNYLEFIFRRPKYLVSCIYAILTILIGWSAAGAVVVGEYVIHALNITPTQLNARLVGSLALTAAFLLHGTRLNWGLRLQNALGIFILLVMAFIVLLGLLVFAFPGLLNVERTDNLEWKNLWLGTRLEANAFVTALYNVSWCFIGYSNANYALSEVRDPVKTIKRAAPLAMLSVTVVYILVNLSYFAVVSKEDILDGGRVVAALFFRNIFGPYTERFVSVIIALSVFGNMLAVQFTQGRVIQELGREGILPYSSWFASNKPFNAPLAALSVQWFTSLVAATLPPPGDAFHFVLQLNSYPVVLANTAVSAGLLFLRSRRAKILGYDWVPPFSAWRSVTAFFFLSNVFLTVVPLVPPSEGYEVYERLPYCLHVLVSLGIALLGALYYYVWCVYLPSRGEYVLVRELVLQEDGVSRSVFKKVKY
ncbi:hypothetical protein ACEPAF_2238 [Sanghuangporus sanghuang]